MTDVDEQMYPFIHRNICLSLKKIEGLNHEYNNLRNNYLVIK